jgi:heptaprenyl diphosphate synthase
LTSFGERFGVAFQLSDDLLDVTADENIFGKEVGKDLKASVATLPVLLALGSQDGGSAKLRELLANKDRSEKEHNETLKLLADSEFITQAREVMDNWLGQARNDLASLPDCPAKEALVALCDGVRARVN